MTKTKTKPKNTSKAKAKPKAATKAASKPTAKTEATISLAITTDGVQTVTATVTPTTGDPTTSEYPLQHGDTINDFRVVVALVGVNHTGVIGPGQVIIDEPGSSFA